MRTIFAIFLFSITATAQPLGNATRIWNRPIDNAAPTDGYSLVWNAAQAKFVFAAGGSGTFVALSGDASSTSTGGATVVNGLKGVPFCTGYTPTNGQAVSYTTAGSPNPCYTAATGGGGATIPSVTNLIKGDGTGNGADAGIAAANVATASSNITDLYSVIGDGGTKGIKVGPAIAQAATASTIVQRDSSGNITAVSFISSGPFSMSGATQAKPAFSTSGSQQCWFDSTNLLLQCQNSSGTTIATTVAPKASRTANRFMTFVDAAGVQQDAVIALADLPMVTVPYGGWGLTTLTAHALYAGNATSAPTAIGPDASTTKVLFSAGSSADPAFRAIAVGDLPVLHGQCTEAWGGSGTSFALTSGDDAIVNNTCYPAGFLAISVRERSHGA